jgi:hypothetical protein
MLELGRVGSLHVNKRRITFNDAVVDKIFHLSSKVNNCIHSIVSVALPQEDSSSPQDARDTGEKRRCFQSWRRWF